MKRHAFETFDIHPHNRDGCFRESSIKVYNVPWMWLNCPLSHTLESIQSIVERGFLVLRGDGLLSVVAGSPLFRGFQCIEVYGKTIGTFRIVRYTVVVRR